MARASPIRCAPASTPSAAAAVVAAIAEAMAVARDLMLAEETGAIVRLGREVLERSVRDARHWYDEFGDFVPMGDLLGR